MRIVRVRPAWEGGRPARLGSRTTRTTRATRMSFPAPLCHSEPRACHSERSEESRSEVDSLLFSKRFFSFEG